MSIDPVAAESDTLVRRQRVLSMPSPLPAPGVGGQASISNSPNVPPAPVPATPLSGRLNVGDLVASANAAFVEVLGGASAYAPVAWDASGGWEDGACRSRAQPSEIAYCDLNGMIYAPAHLPRDTRLLIDLARAVGRHLQAQMGLQLVPLEPWESGLQADCFAGLWARHSRDAGAWLYPERLTQRFNPTGIDLAMGERLEAFRKGYLGTGPADCASFESDL